VLIIKFIGYFLGAAFKFLLVAPAAIVDLHLNFIEAIVFCFTSGMTGVMVTLYLSKYIFQAFSWVKHKITGKHHKRTGKVFTPRKRRLVRFKKTYGLVGISLITPTLLSIPVGTLIAARLYSHDRRHVYIYMAGSLAIWSLIFSAIFTSF
jgi:ABC-type antimicrobial peptide transport system permease subunit